jgi:hypothetical protein
VTKSRTYRYINPFKPLNWQGEPWRDISRVLLLTGSAGGGKSRLAAEKLHAFCLRYPGATALVLRKSRAVIGNSTLIFLRSEVIGDDPRVKWVESKFRLEYENGSMLLWGGMKDSEQRERIRSIGQKGGVDICWMEEATQFEESDFNEVLARMRGTAAPWTQIILTTNPDAPAHWINRRLILSPSPHVAVHYSSASDNPANPESYSEMLDQLTGVEYERLVLGKWAAGSGRVIDTWESLYNPATGEDHGGNVTLDAEYIPDGGDVIWTIDDGYSGKKDKNGLFAHHSHPRAFLLCQVKQNGVIAVFGESFEVEMLAKQHIEKVIDMCEANGWPVPRWAIRDRAAASLGGDLKEYEIISRYNQMTVDESIKELRQWVAADVNGVRRLIVHPRCFYLKHQMLSYSMSPEGQIIKQNDDGPDAARYLVWDQAFGVNPKVDVATWSTVDNWASEAAYG